jgi:hypothetical protein
MTEFLDLLGNPLQVGCLITVTQRDSNRLYVATVVELSYGNRGNEVGYWVQFKTIPTEEKMKSIVRWTKSCNVLQIQEYEDVILLKKLSINELGFQEKIVSFTYPGHIITGIKYDLFNATISNNYIRSKNGLQYFNIFPNSNPNIKFIHDECVRILNKYNITTASFEYYSTGCISKIQLN